MRSSLRIAFLRQLYLGLKIVWPVLGGLLGAMAMLGSVVAVLEGWRLLDGLYYAFVTGLTIGYGDLVPRRILTKALAVLIGFLGILLTGLVAAIAVEALRTVIADQNANRR